MRETSPQHSKTLRVYMKTPTQDLNRQQTFVYDTQLEDQLRSKSANNFNRSNLFDYNALARSIANERDYAKSIRDKYFYSDKETINGINKSKFRNSASYRQNTDHGYTTLPLSKTLVHNKPWSYGKVECIHYPYRDTKLKRK